MSGVELRKKRIQGFQKEPPRQLCIIGGGATGAGAALEAWIRGISFYWITSGDIGEGTSSRSTKLLHGGIRYLAQGEFALVKEALQERQWMLKTYPKFCTKQRFILPAQNHWQAITYRLGLWWYDQKAGLPKNERHRYLGKKRFGEALPGFKGKATKGLSYLDASFADQGFLSALWMEMDTHAPHVLNHARVRGLKALGSTWEIRGVDEFDGTPFSLLANHVLNATGPESIKNMEEWGFSCPHRMVWSQGSHLLLKGNFVDWKEALVVPVSQGRVFFMVPWQNKWLAGTTEAVLNEFPKIPEPQKEEVQEMLDSIEKYVGKRPNKKEVLGQFSGIRPLVSLGGKSGKKASSISRKHLTIEHATGLVSILGGKWTIFRQMGEDGLKTLFKEKLPPILKDYPPLQPLPNIPEDKANINAYFYKSNGAALFPDDLVFRRFFSGLEDVPGYLKNQESWWSWWWPGAPEAEKQKEKNRLSTYLFKAIFDPEPQQD